MSDRARRAADTIRVVDGLVDSHLQDAALGGRPLARLAAAVVIEHSGADWGALLFDRGRGLEPTLRLRHDLKPAPETEGEIDRELVAKARERGAVAAGPDAVAAPMVLGGETRGMLYLDGLEGRGEEAAALAGAVAQRIATFLRSAELVDQVARQERGLAALERLGTLLADRQLLAKHLERAAETARASTGSDFALMARLGDPDRLESASVCGRSPAGLGKVAEALAVELAAHGTLDGARSIARQVMSEPIWRGSIVESGADRAVGYLVVGRDDERPYQTVDRTFLRALAHLIGGALAREEYFRRAAVDPLTETGSRLALQLSLAEAEARAKATGRPFALVIIDVDDFKRINDEHGHPVGDEVLRGVAALLRQRLRSQDLVARYGGDEFVLVLPETSREEAATLAEELGGLIGRARFSDRELGVSVSIGVAISHSERNAEELLAEADKALYDSKAAGRNRVTLDTGES